MNSSKRAIPLMIISGVIVCTSMILNGKIRDVDANRQTGNMNANIESFPNPRILLIGRGSQGFDEMIAARSVPRDLRDDLSDFSVFLVNNSDQPIAGYSVRWEINAQAGGPPITQTIAFIDDVWLGTPTSVTSRGLIAPGSNRFVSLLPGGELFNAQYKVSTESRAKAHTTAIKAAHKLRDRLKSAQSWGVAIDGIVLADGHFIGPNKGGFLENSKAKVDAERDFYRGICTDLDVGLALDTILKKRLTDTTASYQDVMAEEVLTADAFYKRKQQGLAKALINLRTQYSDSDLAKMIRRENTKVRAVIYTR